MFRMPMFYSTGTRRRKSHACRQKSRYVRLCSERLEPRALLAGLISGVTFNDLNQNGVFEAATGETPLAGQTIFLDLNDNFHLDAPEPFQVSGADGRYEFANVAAGTYSARQVDSLGYEPSSPARVEPSSRLVDMTTHLVYDPARDKLYAAVGTAVAIIDQTTGAISASIELGTSPGQMIISDNGEVMYVAINQSKEILAVNLVTLTKGTSFSLGSNRQVNHMQVMPGTTDVLAISWYIGSSSANNLAIFDGGVARPNTARGDELAFSGDGSTLYTNDSDTFITLALNSQGLSILSTTEGSFDGSEFEVGDGRIYTSGGRVIDLQSGTLVGTLPLNLQAMEFALDPDAGLLYISATQYGYNSERIQAYDLQTLRLVGSFELPDIPGQSTQLLLTGDGRLAVNLNCGQFVLINWQPRAASHDVQVADGQTISLDLGNRPAEVPGTIQGQVFFDVNNSRSLNKGEPGLASRTVFLDANANGLLDDGERSTLTDAAGKYVFDGLPPGSYTVAVAAAPGWEATSPSPQEFRVRRLPFVTGDQLYDAARSKLYATVNSEFRGVGNSLVVIDPQTGSIEKSIELGGESSQLAMSRDGKALYVVLNGLNSISRIDLTTLTKDLTFTLGINAFSETLRAADIEVLGDGADTIAVLRSDGRLAIYDNGVLRPGVLYNAVGVSRLTSSPSALYGEWHGKLQRFAVTPAGVSLAFTGPATSLSWDLVYHNGVILSFGKKFDPQTGALIGDAAPTGPESWDVAGSLAFSMYENELSAYDLNTLEFVRSLALERIGGSQTPLYAGNHVLTFGDDKTTYLIDWNPRQPATVRGHNVVVVAGQIVADRNFAEFKPTLGQAPIAVPDSFRIAQPVATTIAAPGVLANDLGDDPASLQAILVDGPTKGTVVLNADGSFAYTPGATFAGLDSFTYRTFNGRGLSEIKQVSIAEALPGGPLALNDSYSMNEDTPRSVPAPGFLFNDTSAVGKPLTATLVAGPTRGQFQFNADGSFDYTPDKDFAGTDRFTYRAQDESGVSRLSTVTLTVLARNDAPTGVDDSYITAQNTTLVVAARGVLTNDLDPENNTLSASLIAGPEHGTVVLSSNGGFTYFPATDYSGPDSFTYRVRDSPSSASANPTTVSLTVTPVTSTPTAFNDNYTLAEDAVLTIPAGEILANDSDPNGLPLTAVLGVTVQHGKLTLTADGKFTYTPSKNYNGPDQFTYRAHSQAGNSGLATVSFQISPVNDPPTVSDDDFRGLQGQVLSVVAPGVLESESDVDQDAIHAMWVDGPANGTLVLRPDGSFEYVPNAGFSGTDRFRYRTSDGTAESRIVNVDLEIESFSQIPVAVNDSIDITEDSLPYRIYPLDNDTDTNNSYNQLAVIVESLPQHGTLSVDEDGQRYYQPASNYTGPDSFTYRVSDGVATGNLATVTLNVLPFNDLPVAKADEYSINEGTPLIVGSAGVLANDTDIDTTPLTATPLRAPAHGQLELQADGSFRYVPDDDFSGTDSFVYGVYDRPSVSGVIHVRGTGPNSSLTYLYAIDLATGNQQLVQALKSDGGYLEYLPDGRLFMLTSYGLREIDTQSGQVHRIVDETSPSTGGGGLAYNPVTDKLYAIGSSDSLMTIDPNTGKRTVVGPLKIPKTDWLLGYWRIGSLAAASDGWLYATLVRQDGPDYLLRIDPATVEVTIVGPTGMNDTGPLEFDRGSGILYMAENSTLFSVSLQSGAATLLKPPAGGSYSFSGGSLAIPTAGPQARATVTIHVAAVNDAPSFVKGDDVHATDEAGPTKIDNWATNILAEGSTAEASAASAQSLTFTVTTEDAGLFLVPPEITPSGSLKFTPKPGAMGSARVHVSLWDDGGTANGGSDHSETQTFTIDITKARVWHNNSLPQDVTGNDGQVAPDDALAIINYINAAQSATVPTDGRGGGPYYDVTGDGHIAPDDVLAVINYMNARSPAQSEAAILSQPTALSQPSAEDLSSDLMTLLAADISAQAISRRRLL